MRIFLCLDEFTDGRVMFRRWSPDGTPPGGAWQKQTLDAFKYLHYIGMPVGVPSEEPEYPPYEEI